MEESKGVDVQVLVQQWCIPVRSNFSAVHTCACVRVRVRACVCMHVACGQLQLVLLHVMAGGCSDTSVCALFRRRCCCAFGSAGGGGGVTQPVV